MIALYFDLSTTEACGLYNYDADAAIMFYVFGGVPLILSLWMQLHLGRSVGLWSHHR